MSFKELKILSEYRTLKNDIVNEFYTPLLSHSVLYRRAVGFFSSSALSEIVEGITGLIKNGGKIEIVASPKLSKSDIEAIEKGYESRKQVIEKAIISSLTDPETEQEVQNLGLLSYLIANRILDFKIALLSNGSEIGMYHEKMGLLKDESGNIVAFTGSMNESETAYRINYESIDVFTSWSGDSERVMSKVSAFDRIWENDEDNVEIFDFPDVKKEILRKYQQIIPKPITPPYPPRVVSDDTPRNIPYMPSSIVLRDYQNEAISNWENEGFRGIFDMATGTGKTLTGLAAITKLSNKVENKLTVVIACPYQHLVEQWVEDILKFNIEPVIGYSRSTQKDWKIRLEKGIRNQNIGMKDRSFLCFISTNATFSSQYVQEQLNKIKGPILLIVDEAHNFGAFKLSRLMQEKYEYRLALSATLERHQDEEGTFKLLRYFGKKCIEYSLERAIRENKLTPYKYFPILVSLSEDERAKYSQLSMEISKCIMFDSNGHSRLNDRGKILAIQRSRIVAGARQKIDELRNQIKEMKYDSHILVYCGAANLYSESYSEYEIEDEDIRQIDAVTQVLGNSLGMKVSQFTSREDIDERSVLIKEFTEGRNLQALIAIKCLDEGVNIPKIKAAFILASSTNPKEYIQRRGRVLRLAEGKPYAVIYDFVTLPRNLGDSGSLTDEELIKDYSLIRNEITRVEEFSRLSMNPMDSKVLIQKILDAYRINRNDLNNTVGEVEFVD